MTESYFLPMKLAGDILDKRTEMDVSFRELSEITGIDKMNLHRMECGNTFPPKLNDFYSICLWLSRPMDTYFIKPKIKINGKANNKKSAGGGRKENSKKNS